jgi:hypothetical protein
MLMRWCEFIAGFGSAVAWPLVRGYAARVYEDQVLSVLSWRDESEAIALAKATEYGLTASILTNNVRTAFSDAQVRLCLDQRRFGPLLRHTFRRLQEQRHQAGNLGIKYSRARLSVNGSDFFGGDRCTFRGGRDEADAALRPTTSARPLSLESGSDAFRF